MEVKNRKCKNCGTENPLKADFCAECGTRFNEKLDAKGSNPISRGASSWNKRSKRFKITTGILGCCVGAFIIIMILAVIFPVTSLSLDNTSVNIDNQTTAYMLKGNTEANTTVKISSTVLNINNVEITPDTNGNFEYEVQIPLNVNTSDVLVTAKSAKKSENTATLTINRPSTSPSTPQNTGTPNKTFTGKDMSFTIPNGWTVDTNLQLLPVGNVNNNLTTYLIKGDDGMEIQVIPNDTNNQTLNSEYNYVIANGGPFKGNFNINGIACDVFTSTIGIEYLFNKNGNTFEILSNSTDSNTQDAMNIIVGTIN